MVLPAGSIVEIGDVKGALAEELSISLSSSFKSLISDRSDTVTQAIDLAGSALRDMTGGSVGFSSQFKQFTTQVWDKTEPASFNINVDFHRVPLIKGDPSIPQNVSGLNVMNVVKKFCSIPLPAETYLGNLVPPGPSPLAGLGIDEIVSRLTGGETEIELQGIIDVVIGKMKFKRLLMLKAEPVFNKYVDTSSYPISCRVAFSFVSLWAATKQFVQSW